MKSSFAKKPAVQAEEVPVVVAETVSSDTVNPQPDQTVAVRQPVGSPALNGAADFTGQWLRKDIKLPRINLVQKSSNVELVRNFGLGAFVIAKEAKISDGETPLIVTALQAAKDYQQKVEFDSGDEAAVFSTEQEVLDAGGTFNYKEGMKEGNYFQSRAHIEFAIGAPEGLSENDLALFPYEFDGTPYTLALYTVASSAFTSLGIGLATLRDHNKVMRQGLRFGNLALTSEVRSKNTKTWHVPVPRFNGANKPELVEFFESIEPRLKGA